MPTELMLSFIGDFYHKIDSTKLFQGMSILMLKFLISTYFSNLRFRL